MERKDGSRPSRGFGVSTRGGNLGSEYGDPRHNMFRTFNLHIWRTYTLRMSWKKPRD